MMEGEKGYTLFLSFSLLGLFCERAERRGQRGERRDVGEEREREERCVSERERVVASVWHVERVVSASMACVAGVEWV